jgi:hypothetical protein
MDPEEEDWEGNLETKTKKLIYYSFNVANTEILMFILSFRLPLMDPKLGLETFCQC